MVVPVRVGHEGYDTWDYALAFTAWRHRLVNVLPNVNLVSNIGFRPDATHTTNGERSLFANLPREPMDFPLRHPASVARDVEADRFTEDVMFSGNLARLLARLRARRSASRKPEGQRVWAPWRNRSESFT